MTYIAMVRVAAIAAVIAGSSPTSLAAQPQPPGVTRVLLQQSDLSIAGREVVQVRVEFAPGASFPAHSHPGEEIVYVIEGVFEYALEGRLPVTLKAGDVLLIPAGTLHRVTNVGSGTAAELATYIVEKGMPLVVTVTK